MLQRTSVINHTLEGEAAFSIISNILYRAGTHNSIFILLHAYILYAQYNKKVVGGGGGEVDATLFSLPLHVLYLSHTVTVYNIYIHT